MVILPPVDQAEPAKDPRSDRFARPGSVTETFARRVGRERLQVISKLGSGGFGSVFRVRDRESGQQLALKVLADASPQKLSRFRREAELAAGLSHVGIVRVHSSGELEGRPFVAYELVEGARTLDTVLPGLPVRRRVELVRDVARALGHAHARGVVHRDVKSQNVLVDREGRARLTDFGLAMAAEEEKLTRTGSAVGTPYSMSPEQVSGKRDLQGPATDVWALGVLLHEALVGRRPFEGPTLVELATAIARSEPPAPSSVARDAPRALDAVVARALAKAPADRFATGDLLADALDAWLAGDADARRARPGLRTRAAVGALGAVAVVGLFAWTIAPASRGADDVAAATSPPPPAPAPVATPAAASAPAPATAKPAVQLPPLTPGVRAAMQLPGYADALAGDAFTALVIGRMLINGAGVPKDVAGGEWFMRRGAETGTLEAMCEFGGYLLGSEAEPRDPVEAVTWLEQAAARGSAWAMRTLGKAYVRGTNLPLDVPRGVALLERAVAAGDVEEARLELAMGLTYLDDEASRRRGRTLLEALVPQLPDQDPVRARVLIALGRVEALLGDPGPGRRHLDLAAQHTVDAIVAVGDLIDAGALPGGPEDAWQCWSTVLDAELQAARRGDGGAMRRAARLIEAGKGCRADAAAATWWRDRGRGVSRGNVEPALRRQRP